MTTDILKIIPDNAANRASAAAAPIAGGLAAANMLTDTTSQVCRATSTSLLITLTWASAERIGGVHLPWCNLSPSATMRVRGFSDTAGTTQVLDTGTVFACPWPSVRLRGDWTPFTAASGYAHGGGAHARSWFSNVVVKRLEVAIVDVAHLQGYVEVSRIIAGESWSPAYNFDHGATLTAAGTGTAFRDGAGGRRTQSGTKFKKLSFALSRMTEADRAAMWSLLLANGTEIPFLISMFPNDASPVRERDYQMYCGLALNGAIRRQNLVVSATTLDLESV
jgi:hypothetical protein